MRVSAKIIALPALLSIGACALPDMDSFRAPTAENLFRPLSVTNARDKVLPSVAPEDMVDASGRCAGAFVPVPAASDADAPGGPSGMTVRDAGVPMIPSAVALDMSECDVVKRAGFPERVEIGASERNERTARLTYINGPRPGIYWFVDGRLRSMERAPEPPAPPKPTKKPGKPGPKPRTASR